MLKGDTVTAVQRRVLFKTYLKFGILRHAHERRMYFRFLVKKLLSCFCKVAHSGIIDLMYKKLL